MKSILSVTFYKQKKIYRERSCCEVNIGLVKILRTLGDNSAEDISSKIQNGADSITANVTEPLLFSLVLKVVFIILLKYIQARVNKFLFNI